MRLILLALLLSACGRVGFDNADGGEADAASDATSDASADAGARAAQALLLDTPSVREVGGAAGLAEGYVVAHSDPILQDGMISFVSEAGTGWTERVDVPRRVLLRGASEGGGRAIVVGGGQLIADQPDNGFVALVGETGVLTSDAFLAPVNALRGVDIDGNGWAAGGSIGDPDVGLLIIDDRFTEGPEGFEVQLGGTSSWLLGVVLSPTHIYVSGQVLPSGVNVIAALTRDTRTPVWANEIPITSGSKIELEGDALLVHSGDNALLRLSTADGRLVSAIALADVDLQGIRSVASFAGRAWFTSTKGAALVYGTTTADSVFEIANHGHGYFAQNELGWALLSFRTTGPMLDLMPLDTDGVVPCIAPALALDVGPRATATRDAILEVSARAISSAPIPMANVDDSVIAAWP